MFKFLGRLQELIVKLIEFSYKPRPDVPTYNLGICISWHYRFYTRT